MQISLVDDAATQAAGAKFSAHCPTSQCTIHLLGDLGAGKTTFVRGFLRGLGYLGKVKSPTYGLVEEYEVATRAIYHFDLYRLMDPEELDYLGMDDYFRGESINLIEWPQRAAGMLPTADVVIHLHYEQQSRLALCEPTSKIGEGWLNALSQIKD